MALQFDERGIAFSDHLLPWTDLVSVSIRTTASGPFAEDVWWMFGTRERYLELPGALVDSERLAALQKALPLDSRKIIDAMGSTRERIFRLWHVNEVPAVWTDDVLRTRFAGLVERLGGDARGAETSFRGLQEAWSTPTRQYHNLEHLTDCLRELDRVGAPSLDADVVELALWYHDAVYSPGAADSEEKSAQLLLRDAVSMRVPQVTAKRAADLVRTTDHLARPAAHGPTADLVHDIDLAILGRDAARFMEFEYSVGDEYSAVPRLGFVVARGRFLACLLGRPSLYRTEFFRARYEADARRNITALLRCPRYRAYRWLRWLPHRRR